MGNGLKSKMPLDEAVKLASALGYQLTKRGRAVLNGSGAGDVAVAEVGNDNSS